MIEQNEVLIRKGKDWLHFAAPHCVLSTTTIHEVRDLLREAERLVDAEGWHAAGFLSYESAPAFDRALQVRDTAEFPLLWFGLYPQPKLVEVPESRKVFDNLAWQATVTREEYYSAIERIREYIARGRTYQVNYTMRLRARLLGSAWELFLRLAANQNKYAAYVETADHVICSASPELLFELDGESITSRPMKGTVQRGRTTGEDEERSDWLRNSTKNRAENVMITDMIRNDIGRIAELGSVKVPELFAIEKYPTLFQMTSTVRARTNASVADILGALYPGGSITGAPKVSTMKIIAELETSPRRIYTGTLGYLSPGRRAQFNVAIRTVLVDKRNGAAEYGVGGGIVWDSTGADEYAEALLKSRLLAENPAEFSLIETMLWTREDGYFLLEKHLSRLQDSAAYFDFAFFRDKLESQLHALAGGFAGPQRVRLLLDASGASTAEAAPFEPTAAPFKACLAKEPVDSADVFLFHKTTQRQVYENALVVPQIYNDVLLRNERNELTEFTIGNLVIELDGELVTPPVSCGLLPGTFRAHLLETGAIRERIVHRVDLQSASRIFLVNSVRKWVDVRVD